MMPLLFARHVGTGATPRTLLTGFSVLNRMKFAPWQIATVAVGRKYDAICYKFLYFVSRV
jgi:hypothetical protein